MKKKFSSLNLDAFAVKKKKILLCTAYKTSLFFKRMLSKKQFDTPHRETLELKKILAQVRLSIPNCLSKSKTKNIVKLTNVICITLFDMTV